MVLQKKGGSATKNPQTKKGKAAFDQVEDDDLDMFVDMEDMDDDSSISDDDSDSDEGPTVQKTPQNKTPKGRQSLSEKRVSFQVPGKNTPAKTPNFNTLVVKKPPTPGSKGKTAVQEFKGMKGKKNQSKQDDEDDDDDDEDDDEEDDDLDDLKLDDDDDDDEDVDDDDDDDDDDDEEDDDEDDEDDDQEEAGKIHKKTMLKQNSGEQNKQKTPSKVADKSKNVDTPKGKNTQVKKEKESPTKTLDQLPTEVQRRKARDAKMLYVGNLPKEVTQSELKALSPDILDVVMPFKNRHREAKVTYAFLVFASEKKAEENFKTLQSKKFRGQLFNVDFVGEKSKNVKRVQKEKQYNLKKLHVSGIPVTTTLAEIAKFFPKAYQICLNSSSEYRTASINYTTVEDATEAFESNKDSEIHGQKMIVLHSVSGSNKKHNRKRASNAGRNNNFGNKNKRVKKNED